MTSEVERLTIAVLELKRGSHIWIKPDGQWYNEPAKPTIDLVYRTISTPDRKCRCCDTVLLRKRGLGGRQDPLVMMVDDLGMADGLPVNELATALVKLIRPMYSWKIHGTAVVVNDADFEVS